MSFKEWILQFKGEDSPFGDLCDDICADAQFPADAVERGAILSYLREKRACAECVATFEDAWNDYSKVNGGTTSTI